VKELIPRLFLVKAITFLVKNIVEDVRFTCIMKACFVHAVVCNFGTQQLVEGLKKDSDSKEKK